jgi:hypothetical protein
LARKIIKGGNYRFGYLAIYGSFHHLTLSAKRIWGLIFRNQILGSQNSNIMPREIMDSCFLCSPSSQLIYAQNDSFYVMLGIGPIMEGFSIIGSKSHLPSMFDIDIKEAEILAEFKVLVRDRLLPYYGKVILTEHGRVSPCVSPANDINEAHCFHAHLLVFPLSEDLPQVFNNEDLQIEEYPSYLDALRNFSRKHEYYYYERFDGSCLIAHATRRLGRQFFRYRIADYLGCPQYADWKQYLRLDIVEKAKLRLESKDISHYVDQKKNK